MLSVPSMPETLIAWRWFLSRKLSEHAGQANDFTCYLPRPPRFDTAVFRPPWYEVPLLCPQLEYFVPIEMHIELDYLRLRESLASEFEHG